MAAPLNVPVRRFGREHGLPSGQVHQVAADPRDFIWFAGPAGLSRWDGASMRTYGRAAGLSSQGLRALAVSPDGLWVGGDAGLDFMTRDERIVRAPGLEQRPGELINDLAVIGAELWVTTSVDLVRHARGQWHRHAGPEPVASLPLSVIAGADGSVWLCAGAEGLWQRVGNDWRRHWVDGIDQPATALQLADGTLLVGGSSGLAVKAPDSDRWQHVSQRPTTHLATTGDHEVWAVVDGQIAALEQLRDLRPVEGVAQVSPTSLCVDRVANLWVGTQNHGAVRVDGLRRVLERPAGVPERAVFSLRESGDGSVWVGSERESHRWSRTPPAKVQPIAELEGEQVWDLFEATPGVWWAATEGGVFRADAAGLRRVVGDERLEAPGRCVRTFAGHWWLGTVRGLVRCDERGDHVAPVVPRQGRLGYVYGLTQVRDRLLVATLGHGLWQLEANGVLTRVEGEALREDSNCYAVCAFDETRTFVLQDDALLELTAGGARVAWTSEDAVAGWALERTPEGLLLIGTSAGLVFFDPVAGLVTRRLSAWLGSGWEFTTARSLLLSGSTALCGLAGGVVTVDLSRLAALPQPPPCRLIGAEWLGAVPEQRGSTWHVTEGRWSLELSYACGWFVDEASLRYRHRLRGFNEQWSAWRKSPTLSYSSLDPGHYTVEVQADSQFAGLSPPAEIADLFVHPSAQDERAEAATRFNEALDHAVRQRTWELEQANAALEALDAAVYELTVDPAGVVAFTYLSPGVRNLLQVSVEEVLLNPLALFDSAPGFDSGSWLRQLADADERINVEVEVLAANREPRWVSLSAVPTTTSGDGRRFRGVLLDVTERIAIDHSRDDFISTVSHELRTPLTSLRGALSLLQAGKGGEQSARMAKLTSLANRNAERLGKLVDDILDVQRISSGRLQMTVALHDAGVLLQQAVEACAHYGAGRGVKLSITSQLMPAQVQVDPDRFVQLLGNLLSNAVKFSPDGGTVECSLRAATQEVTVAIRDRGPGIPEEFRSQLFGRFSRARAHSSVPGSGLGLSIAKALAEGFGGRITFETALGEGTTFFVVLPRAGPQPRSG